MNNTRVIKVGLVQIGNNFGNQHYLPYSIGILQAYAQKNLKEVESFMFSLPVYSRLKVEKAVSYLSNNNIVFFSAYIWNYQLSLAIAEKLKERDNECVIVFGGPQVPEAEVASQRFMQEYPFIDIAVYGEGEEVFLKILENFNSRDWGEVSSISYRAKGGGVLYRKKAARLIDLAMVPSPYLEGVFGSLMREYPQEKWCALIETNRGCPFTCAFCYWGNREKNVRKFGLDRIFQEIDWLSRANIEFVFCCDANFGILKRDKKIVMKVAENKEVFRYPMAFSVQNTKNSSQAIFEVQKILNDHGLQKGVNLALQSVDGNTLKNIGRSNISNNTYSQLQEMFAKEGIPTFSDLIIALPGETYDTFSDGVSRLIESGQHNRIQFINLTVLPGTLLSDKRYQKEHSLVIKRSRFLPHHTELREDEVAEYNDIVTATKTMPDSDWLRAKIFSWYTSLLFFNKLLQVPFIILNRQFYISYRRLIELFVDSSNGRILEELNSFLRKKASAVQGGETEYCASKERLNIWWPIDEFLFIKVCAEYGLDEFYSEAQDLLVIFLKENGFSEGQELLKESIRLNKQLIKLPFKNNDENIKLSFNLWEVYSSVLRGDKVDLKRELSEYIVKSSGSCWHDWGSWCSEVVWYGSKRGAYLYACEPYASGISLQETSAQKKYG